MEFDPERFEEEKYAEYFTDLQTAYKRAFETMNEQYDSGLVHAIDQRVLAESEPFYEPAGETDGTGDDGGEGEGQFRIDLPEDPHDRVREAGVVVEADRLEAVLDRYVEELAAELCRQFGLESESGPKA